MVPSTASITNFIGSGNADVYGGGSVNGETTPTNPSTPTPPSPTPPQTTPPAPVGGGGGGGGGGGSSPSVPSTQISSFTLHFNNNADINGASTSVDLSADSLSDKRITSLQITAVPAGSTLQLTSLSSPKTGTVSFTNKSFSLSSPITMQSLLGNAIQGEDVSISSMRELFGPYVTFYGTLTAANYTSSSVSLTLNLGTNSADLNNQWADITVDSSTRVITAVITAGNTKVSSMEITNLFTTAGVMPTLVSTDQTNWYDPTNQQTEIQSAIASLASNSTGVTPWANLTLSQLEGKTVYFKDQNHNIWTVNFS